MKRVDPVVLLGLATFVVLLPLANAHAQESEPKGGIKVEDEDSGYSRHGGYLGVGGALAIEDFDSSRGSYGDSGAVMIRAGYRGLSYLSVEFVGDILLGFDQDEIADNDIDGFAATVNAKFHAPLGRVEPFLAVGTGILELEEDDRNDDRGDFVFRFAAGLDVYLNKHLVLYGETTYMLGLGEVSDFDYATVGGGLMIRF